MLFKVIVFVLALSSVQAASPVNKKKMSYPPISLADLPVMRVPFYEIRKAGEKAYLLGTLHYGVEYRDLPYYVKRISQLEAETIVIETDLLKAHQASDSKKASKPVNLKKELTKNEWVTLRDAVAPLMAQNVAMLESLDPATASAVYMLSFLPVTKEPMDAFIMVRAAQSGKRLVFLEEMVFQQELLGDLLTLKELKQQLNTPKSELKKESLKLLNAYKSGDLKQLGAVIFAEMQKNKIEEEQYKKLFDDRNINWVNKFDDIFNAPGIEFMAVGAGHLIGEKGLIKLLQKRGYTVAPYQEKTQRLKRNISSQ